MAGKEIYIEILYLGIFLTGLWVAGWACERIKVTPIIGQILFGILLGPNGIDFVPLINGYEYLQDAKVVFEATAANITAIPEPFDLDKSSLQNFLVALGDLGVTFLIFESGLHVDFETVKRVGPSAILVAVLGTIFSMCGGIAIGSAYGFDSYPEGLGLGAVIAPTSVGIALKLLVDSNVLDSVFGQTIVTAAFTDDIFSLITLALLRELATGKIDVSTFMRPLGLVLAFIFISIFLALKVMPRAMKWFLTKFNDDTRDYVHLISMFGIMAIFGFFGTFVGSHLLGAFFAGIAVSRVPRTSQVWANLVERETAWLLALFFGATVAFKVPVNELLSFESFWKGFLLGIACIAAKVLAGLPLKHRWIVGWAMVGRGEFSFLVGEILKITEFEDTNKPFLSQEAFGIAVWALMIAIIVAPIAFEIVLKKQLAVDTNTNVTHHAGSTHYLQTQKESPKSRATNNIIRSMISIRRKEIPRSHWKVIINTKPQKNFIADVLTVFNELDAEVLLVKNNLSGDYVFHIMVVEPTSSMSKDEYFEFNILSYIERLKSHLNDLMLVKSNIHIERLRIGTPNGVIAGVSDELSNVPSHDISFAAPPRLNSTKRKNKQPRKRRDIMDDVSPIPP